MPFQHTYISRTLPRSHLKGPWMYPQGGSIRLTEKGWTGGFYVCLPLSSLCSLRNACNWDNRLAQSLLGWTRVTVGETAWNGTPRWEKSGFAVSFLTAWKKNKQKSSMRATHRRKKLPWFAVYRCSPTRLGSQTAAVWSWRVGMVVQYLMGSPSVSPSEEGLWDVLVT